MPGLFVERPIFKTIGAILATLTITSSLILSSGATITGNLIPAADATYDVGTSTARWRNGYFSGVVTGLMSASSSDFTGLTWTNATGTNTTSTNLFATNGSFTNLTVTNPITLSGLIWTNATGTNTTSTNLFTQNFTVSKTTSATTTLECGSTTSPCCFKWHDYQGSGITWVTASSGVLFASTSTCQ